MVCWHFDICLSVSMSASVSDMQRRSSNAACVDTANESGSSSVREASCTGTGVQCVPASAWPAHQTCMPWLWEETGARRESQRRRTEIAAQLNQLLFRLLLIYLLQNLSVQLWRFAWIDCSAAFCQVLHKHGWMIASDSWFKSFSLFHQQWSRGVKLALTRPSHLIPRFHSEQYDTDHVSPPPRLPSLSLCVHPPSALPPLADCWALTI